jgi:hypothetical protein
MAGERGEAGGVVSYSDTAVREQARYYCGTVRRLLAGVSGSVKISLLPRVPFEARSL